MWADTSRSRSSSVELAPTAQGRLRMRRDARPPSADSAVLPKSHRPYAKAIGTLTPSVTRHG